MWTIPFMGNNSHFISSSGVYVFLSQDCLAFELHLESKEQSADNWNRHIFNNNDIIYKFENLYNL